MHNPAPVTLADAFTQPVAAVDVVLRDGTTARLRSADNTDREGLRMLFAQLSDESRYFRFLRATGRSDRSCELIADIDYPRNVSLVAERGHTLLGVATCARERADDAHGEVAFVVAEGFHGHGLATRMLERLAELARPLGIERFEAWVNVSNREMLAVFRNSGFTVAHHDQQAGVSRLVLDLHQTTAFLNRAASRASTAAVASLEAFFRPRVVAVVGASRSRGKIGAEVFHAITAGGFTGTVIPVNPAGGAIGAVQAVPRVTAIEGPVDLGIIAVPAAQVEAVVDDCIEKGVKAIVIVTAGFSERDAAGRASEARIVEKVRDAGIRLIGPNCMGLVQTDPAVSLNASFAPSMPPRGRVAFLSQSGALGLAILENARRLQLGISTFVSVGNKADVSGNDLVQYLGGRRRHRRHPPVPRKLRQPAQLCPHCPAGGTNQAHRRRQGRPIHGRRARGFVAYRRHGDRRPGRRRPLRTGGHHQNGHARGALRRRDAAGPSAAAAWTARRGPHERRWTGDPCR